MDKNGGAGCIHRGKSLTDKAPMIPLSTSPIPPVAMPGLPLELIQTRLSAEAPRFLPLEMTVQRPDD